MADLCDLGQVKAALEITNTGHDTMLGELISGVSPLIEKEAGRAFAISAYEETFLLDGQPSVLLKHDPIVAITSVSLNGVALANSRYRKIGPRLYPAAAPSDPFLKTAHPVWGQGETLVVSYTAGYATTPWDVQLAAIETVVLRYRGRTNLGMTSQSMPPGGSTTFDHAALTPTAKRVVGYYRSGPRIG